MAQAVWKILICEDDADWIKKYTDRIGDLCQGSVEIIFARTTQEAHTLYAEHKGDFALIVMDGCLNPDGNPDGCDLTRNFRELGFTRPIIAASSSNDLNDYLIQSGCSHSARSKNQIPFIVEDLLSEMAAEPKPPTEPSTAPTPPPTATL